MKAYGTLIILYRLLVRAGKVAGQSGMPEAVKQVYDDRVAPRATAFCSAHDAVVAAESASSAARRKLGEGIAVFNSPYCSARAVVLMYFPVSTAFPEIVMGSRMTADECTTETRRARRKKILGVLRVSVVHSASHDDLRGFCTRGHGIHFTVRTSRGSRAWMALAFASAGCASPPAPAPPRAAPSAALAPAAAVTPAPAAVSGRVVDAAGKPLDGALVAVIPHFELIAWDETTTPITVTSSDGGQFRFAGAAPGRYGVTAHAPGVTGGYGGVVSIERGGAPAEVTVKLGGPGFLVHGTVTDAAGAPVAGAIIQVVRFSENEGDIYVALTDARGRYALTVPEGLPYLVVVDAPPRPRFHRQIEPVASKVDARLGPIPAPRPSDDVLRGWLQANAVALATTVPGSGTADLAPLRSMIGSARIVGLGEATHGSSEFFRMKHRLLEFLVEQMGFRVFAMEAGWGDCLAINDYVVQGKGDAADVVRSLHTHPWETEEVVELVRWMRRYNEDPRHKEKIEFQGFDIVTGDAPPALAYLKIVDPARAKENEELLVPFNAPWVSDAWAKAGVRERLLTLLARFDAEKQTWVARTSEAAWGLARRHVDQLRVAQEIFVDQTVRDKHMADNVAHLVDTHPPGTRLVLWAHNSHIGAAPIEWSDMGARLRQRWGKDYFTLGFAFDHGSFRAFERLPEGKLTPWKPMSLGPAPPGTFAAALGLSDKPLFLLDLRTAPPAVGDWLSGPVPSWQLGGWFMGEKQALARHPWAKSFDAVIYVQEVSAAHALPKPDAARPQH